jgi:hypothetical protein
VFVHNSASALGTACPIPTNNERGINIKLTVPYIISGESADDLSEIIVKQIFFVLKRKLV